MKMHIWCFAFAISIFNVKGGNVEEHELKWSELSAQLEKHVQELNIQPCTEEALAFFCSKSGVSIEHFPLQLRTFTLQFGKTLFTNSSLDFICFQIPDGPQGAVTTIRNAWQQGVPKNYLPFIMDNANYYCINLGDGSVRLWDHNKTPQPGFSPNPNDQWASFFDFLSCKILSK